MDKNYFVESLILLMKQNFIEYIVNEDDLNLVSRYISELNPLFFTIQNSLLSIGDGEFKQDPLTELIAFSQFKLPPEITEMEIFEDLFSEILLNINNFNSLYTLYLALKSILDIGIEKLKSNISPTFENAYNSSLNGWSIPSGLNEDIFRSCVSIQPFSDILIFDDHFFFKNLKGETTIEFIYDKNSGSIEFLT